MPTNITTFTHFPLHPHHFILFSCQPIQSRSHISRYTHISSSSHANQYNHVHTFPATPTSFHPLLMPTNIITFTHFPLHPHHFILFSCQPIQSRSHISRYTHISSSSHANQYNHVHTFPATPTSFHPLLMPTNIITFTHFPLHPHHFILFSCQPIQSRSHISRYTHISSSSHANQYNHVHTFPATPTFHPLLMPTNITTFTHFPLHPHFILFSCQPI